jgi:hypothetical protein
MYRHLSSQELTDLAEGLVAKRERKALDAHLASCELCREALASRQNLVDEMRQGLSAYLEQVTPPPTLRWQRIRDRVPHKKKENWSRTMWRPLRSATATMAVTIALIGLALGLGFLFRQMAILDTPADKETASEPVVEMKGRLAAVNGPFGYGPMTVTLKAALPQVADVVPLYRVEPALEEASAEQVRVWAERLEMGPVRVFRTSGPTMMMPSVVESDSYTGFNADWDRLTLSARTLSFMGGDLPFSRLAVGIAAPSEMGVDEATARAAAQAFIDRAAPWLIEITGEAESTEVAFAVVPNPDVSSLDTGFHGFTVEPVINGMSMVEEGAAENTILVGPEGKISLAMLTPLQLTATGETIRPRAPEAVLQDLFNGRPGVLRGTGWSSQIAAPVSGPVVFERDLSYQEGERIGVVGWLEVLQGVDKSEDLFLLQAFSFSGSFILEGADLAPTADAPLVQVWGTLGGAEAANVRRLEVERWEMADLPRFSWEGQVEWLDRDLWLTTNDGLTFLLPDPPQDLIDGANVGVIGAPSAEDPNSLEWTLMVLQPEGEGEQALEGQSIQAGSETMVVEVVEPATTLGSAEPPASAAAPASETEDRVTAPPLPTTPTPVAAGAGSPIGVVQAMPAPGGPAATLPDWWKHEPGDAVTVEGVLFVNGFELPNGEVQIYAHMQVQGPAEADSLMMLPLGGDALVELLPLDQLHVRVRGEILSVEEATDKLGGMRYVSSSGQVLWEEQVEQLWPGERKDLFSGPLRAASVTGQEVALLDDQRSGETFALPLEMVAPLLNEEQTENTEMAFIAVFEPEQQIGSYPLLRVLETHAGEGAVAAAQERLEHPLQKAGPSPDGPSEVIVDQVRVVYRASLFYSGEPGQTGAEAAVAEVLYYLIGRSPDGEYQVTLRLETVEPMAQP